MERGDLVAERRPQGVEGGGRVGVLAIALVDDEERGRAGPAAQPDGRLEACLDAGRSVHDEERGVGGMEALDHLGHEVGVAGRVDDRDPMALVVERRDREAERLLALLLLGLEVEVGGPVVDPAEPGNGAGSKEDLLGKRRLARAGVTGEHDAPEVGEVDALHRHRQASSCTGSRPDGRRKRGSGGPVGA